METILERSQKHFLNCKNELKKTCGKALKNEYLSFDAVMDAWDKDLKNHKISYLKDVFVCEFEKAGLEEVDLDWILDTAKRWHDNVVYSYEMSEIAKREGIKGSELLINTIDGIKSLNKACSDALKSATEQAINIVDSVLLLLDDLKTYDQNKPEKQYHIFGSACALVHSYSGIDEDMVKRQKNVIDDYCVGLSKVKKDLSKNFINPLEKIYQTASKIIHQKETLAICLIAVRIMETKLLPDDLCYPDAAFSIAGYFKNRRVDNEKEAINLYFQEQAVKENQKRNAEEIAKYVQIVQQTVSLISKQMEEQHIQTAMAMHNIQKVAEENKKKQEELADKASGLQKDLDELKDKVDE